MWVRYPHFRLHEEEIWNQFDREHQVLYCWHWCGFISEEQFHRLSSKVIQHTVDLINLRPHGAGHCQR